MEINKIKEEIKSFLETLNYDLYDIEIKKHKKDTILTIYIDRDKDISMDDVVNVTKLINPFMDELDPFKGEYLLEVSSPGAEKELRTESAVKNAVGKYVHVETYIQKFNGNLESFNGYELSLKIKNKIIKVNYEEVNLIRLAIKF